MSVTALERRPFSCVISFHPHRVSPPHFQGSEDQRHDVGRAALGPGLTFSYSEGDRCVLDGQRRIVAKHVKAGRHQIRPWIYQFLGGGLGAVFSPHL